VFQVLSLMKMSFRCLSLLLLLVISYLLVSCAAYRGVGRASVGSGNILLQYVQSQRKSFKRVEGSTAGRFQTTALLARRRGSRRRTADRGSWVTPTNILIALNVLGYLAVMKNPYLRTQLMKIDFFVSRGQFYRLFTSCFMHGSVPHIAMNSYSLYNIGPQTEQLFGPSRFLFIYLASGLLANIGTYIAGTSPYALGASGCVFGLLGALGGYFMTNKKILGRSSEYALESLKQTMFINVLYGFYQPNVDQWAHLGGAAAGALLAYLIGPRLALVKSRVGASYRIVDKNQRFASWLSSPWESIMRMQSRLADDNNSSEDEDDGTFRMWQDGVRKVKNMRGNSGGGGSSRSRRGETNFSEYGDLSDD